MLSQQTNTAALTALVRDKGDQVDQLLVWAADALQSEGLKVAGVVQQAQTRADACCDNFSLKELATGKCYALSQDLGVGASGCRLNYATLMDALVDIEGGLTADTDALILNRFGFSESKGGGFRPLIERAVELEIPVLLSVNQTYLEAWKNYAGDYSHELPANMQSVKTWYSVLQQHSDQSMQCASLSKTIGAVY